MAADPRVAATSEPVTPAVPRRRGPRAPATSSTCSSRGSRPSHHRLSGRARRWDRGARFECLLVGTSGHRALSRRSSSSAACSTSLARSGVAASRCPRSGERACVSGVRAALFALDLALASPRPFAPSRRPRRRDLYGSSPRAPFPPRDPRSGPGLNFLRPLVRQRVPSVISFSIPTAPASSPSPARRFAVARWDRCAGPDFPLGLPTWRAPRVPCWRDGAPRRPGPRLLGPPPCGKRMRSLGIYGALRHCELSGACAIV